MELGKVCIQSFAPHGVEFLTRQGQDGGGGKLILTIPSGSVKDNFVVTDQSVVDSLSEDKTFKALLEAKFIRLLDKVPDKYADPVLEIQKVRANLVAATESKNAEVDKNAKLAAENEILKAELKALKNGGKVS